MNEARITKPLLIKPLFRFWLQLFRLRLRLCQLILFAIELLKNLIFNEYNLFAWSFVSAILFKNVKVCSISCQPKSNNIVAKSKFENNVNAMRVVPYTSPHGICYTNVCKTSKFQLKLSFLTRFSWLLQHLIHQSQYVCYVSNHVT